MKKTTKRTVKKIIKGVIFFCIINIAVSVAYYFLNIIINPWLFQYNHGFFYPQYSLPK